MMLPGNRRAAISFTFDDGSQSHVDVALPLFEEFGLKATFFVIAGLTRERKRDPLPAGRSRKWWAEVSWEEWRDVARRGHEIGNHSLTHPVLPRVHDRRKLESEIFDSARIIEERVGQRPVSFAFPYNKSNARVQQLVVSHHQAVREQQVRYGGKGFTAQRANRLVDRALRKGSWLVPMIHGVGGGLDPLDPVVLRRHLQYIRERESELWVDTFGSVSRLSA